MKRIISMLLCIACVFICTSSNYELMIVDLNRNSNDVELNEWLFPPKTYNTSEYYRNDATIFLDENYMSYYFYNLTNNFGNNIKGSCAHVAFAMLLSYYDTFWNDDIIDENYDMMGQFINAQLELNTDSPGIRTEHMDWYGGIVNPNMTASDYSSVVDNYSNTYLHLSLIDQCKDIHNYYDLSDDDGPCGLNSDEAYAMMNYYINTNGLSNIITLEKVESANLMGTNVREYTIDCIKSGKPVWLAMSSLLNGGHAFIAYDYDEENDEIYCHWGWDASHFGWTYDFEHIALSTTGKDIYLCAITFDINEQASPHSCSNNYVLSTSSGVTEFCSCFFKCHPEHNCSFEPYDDEQHIYSCTCVNLPNNKFDHEFEYVMVNDTYHILKCECGATSGTQSLHTFSFSDSGSSRRRCIGCGAWINTGTSGGIYPIFSIKPPIVETEYSE